MEYGKLSKLKYSKRVHQPFGNGATEAQVVTICTGYCDICQRRVSVSLTRYVNSPVVGIDRDKQTVVTHLHDPLSYSQDSKRRSTVEHMSTIVVDKQEIWNASK